MHKKKILIIGSYTADYPRNKVLLDVLKERYDVEEANIKEQGLRKYALFLRQLFLQGREKDMVIAMQPAHKFALLLFCYKIFTRKRIIIDAFYSIYDSFVYDRKLVGRVSVKAVYYYILDFLLCRAGDMMLFDTKEHKKYFQKTFRLSHKKKTAIVPVSLDLSYHDSVQPYFFQDKNFHVVFYGYYIPLQGVEYIVRAAKEVESIKDIHFTFIGSGQTRKEINVLAKKLELTNCAFLDRVPYATLLSYVKGADICLGIFGASDKTVRVIPNKVLDAAACGKMVLTARTSALERYFEEGRDILYCKSADAHDLAEKIRYAYNHRQELRSLGERSRNIVERYFSKQSLQKIVAKEL